MILHVSFHESYSTPSYLIDLFRSDYQYDVDSEMSSASFISSPPSDHEDGTGSQSYISVDDKALYEESRRLVAELDARIADLSSGTVTTIDDEQKQKRGKKFNK